jgi:hypothetical protein
VNAQKPDTTVVITSCQRYDLLARTLESFRKFNTDGGVARILVVEDGDGDPSAVCQRFGAELLRTGARIGQIAAIDLAYSNVETPYIFHLEDDWEFYRSGFMERSRAILEIDPSTLIVLLRAWNDTGGHPLMFRSDDRTFGVMAINHMRVWHGFTFNPGLRRLLDYRRLGAYSKQKFTVNYIHRKPSLGLQYEVEASQFYFRLGFRSVILDETGYLRHIGEDRHVSHPDDAKMANVAALIAEQNHQAYAAPAPARSLASRNAPCPCGSGKRYKHCHGRA